MHPATAQSLLIRRPTRLGGFVVLSVAGHALVVAAAVVIGLFHSTAPVDLDQKPIKATLVRLGKERDKRLLPRKDEPPPPPREVKSETPPTPVEPAPPKETVPIPGVKPEPKPSPAKQAGAKTASPTHSLFDAFNKVASKTPPEELEGAADGDPDGDSATQEGERYYGALRASVHRNYDVSSTISEQERLYLKAVVLLRIGTRGELLQAKISTPSGNALFDSAVLGAVKKASPFGPPPDHLRDQLQGRGILLEFTP